MKKEIEVVENVARHYIKKALIAGLVVFVAIPALIGIIVYCSLS